MPRPTPTPARRPFDPLPWLAGAAIVVAVFLAYRPAAGGAFIWDDDDYVSANDTLTRPGGLAAIWADPTASPQYYPLVFTTFWVEHRLWGTDPRGYHEVNVLLHAASAVLLWRLLKRLGVPGAFVAAMVFAVHPVMVESVAWITERKNALSMLFYLSSAWAYLRFAAVGERETPGRPRRGLYAAALALFVGALLSKTVTASLPAALLLTLWWKRGRVAGRDWLSLAPMFALGVAAGLFTAHLEASHVGAAGPEWNYTPAQRVLIAGRAVWFYAAKLVWPADLAFVYAKWPVEPAAAWQWMFPVAAVAAMAALFVLRNRLGRGPLVAMLIFVGTLVPALGFVNVYPMRYTFVADHYQYHASAALMALVVAGAATVLGGAAARRRFPYARPALGGVAVVALFVLTIRQASIYKDSATLWADTVARSPGSWMAWVNAGKVAGTRVPPDKAAALAAYRKAVDLAPDVADPHYLIGVAHLDRDDVPAALAEFTRAVELEPRHASSVNMKGYCLVRLGKADEGIALYRRAIELEPRFADPRFNLGIALRDLGRPDEAAGAFAGCVAIDPNRAVAWRELADCRVKQRRFGEAIEPLERYLELRPDDAKAHLDLSRLLAAAGRNDEALAHINRAVRLNPQLGRIAQPPPAKP